MALSNETYQKIDEILNTPIDELIREGQDINFEDIKPEIEEIISIISMFRKYPNFLNTLPSSNLQNIINSWDQLINEVSIIKNINIQHVISNNNYIQTRKNNIKSHYNNLFQPFILPLKLYFYSKEIDEPVNLMKDAEDLKEQQRNLVEESKLKVKEIEKAKNAVIEEDVKIFYSNQFESLEEQFKTNADIWQKRLVYSITFLLLLLLVILISKFITIDETILSSTSRFITNLLSLNNTVWFEIAFVQLIVISLLSWVIIFCNKNFKVNKNLEYIYKQKHTMLQVYPSYSNLISEVGVSRDKVTAELGSIIFNIPHTGYVKSNGEGVSDPHPTIINNLADSISKTISK